MSAWLMLRREIDLLVLFPPQTSGTAAGEAICARMARMAAVGGPITAGG